MPTHTDLETVSAGRYTDRIAFYDYDIAPAPMANTGVDIDVYTKDQVDAIVYQTKVELYREFRKHAEETISRLYRLLTEELSVEISESDFYEALNL